MYLDFNESIILDNTLANDGCGGVRADGQHND